MRHWLETEWDIASWSESTLDHAIQGSPDECVEQLKAHVASGVDRLILIPYRYQPEQVEIIAKEILPRVQGVGEAVPAEYDAIADEYRDSKYLPFAWRSSGRRCWRCWATCAADGCWTWPAARASTAGSCGGSAPRACTASTCRRRWSAWRRRPSGRSRSGAPTPSATPVACAPGALGQFDVVMAVYLLNYARTADALHEMARSIAGQLAPGGRWWASTTTRATPWSGTARCPSTTFERTVNSPRAEGMRIRYRCGRPTVATSGSTTTGTPRRPTSARSRRPASRTSPSSTASRGPGPDGTVAPLWRAFLEDCPITGLEATR